MDKNIQQLLYSLFLSYNAEDIEAVNLLASALMDSGIRVWFDKWELIPGEPWEKIIFEAMNQSSIIGICIGSSGMGAWNENIIQLSLSKEDAQSNIIIILLPGANSSLIPDMVRNYQIIDFKDHVKAIDKIKWIVTARIEGGPLFSKGSKLIWNVPYYSVH